MSKKRKRLPLAPQSPRDRTGDKGFILKTDYCFLTTQCLAFNPMDHTGWIALLILSFPTATAGSEETAIWESSSITVLHQSRDVNQKWWRNTSHRTHSVTDILSTEYVTEPLLTCRLYSQIIIFLGIAQTLASTAKHVFLNTTADGSYMKVQLHTTGYFNLQHRVKVRKWFPLYQGHRSC